MKKVFSKLVVILMCFLSLVFVACKKEEVNAPSKNPTKEYVISCLQKVPKIKEIEAVLEVNDPNGLLNKEGGYKEAIYFSYELIDQEEFYTDNLIEKGVDAGGCIEVFETAEMAEERNDYLALFDGVFLTSGSHVVVGSTIIRTSDILTASEQNLLTNNIRYALKGEFGKILKPKQEENNDFELREEAMQEAERYAQYCLDKKEVENNYVTPSYLIGYLQSIEGGAYSEETALYAFENSNIDWEIHAQRYIKPYLSYEENWGQHAWWYSEQEISEFLIEEEFALDIIDVVLAEIDWDQQLKKYVQHLSSFYDTFNRLSAKEILNDILSNEAGISNLLENSNVDWKTHAKNMANELWIEYSDYGYYDIEIMIADIKDELIRVWGYTNEEAGYAVENIDIK